MDVLNNAFHDISFILSAFAKQSLPPSSKCAPRVLQPGEQTSSPDCSSIIASLAQTVQPLPLSHGRPLENRLLLDSSGRLALDDLLSLHSVPRALEPAALRRRARKESHIYVIVLHQLL